MDKKEFEVKKFGLTDNINGEKTLDLSLKINTKAYDWLKDIAKIKPQFVPETVEPSEWFDKAQKKQIEAMNDIARNSMQCCMPKHSLCDTCRKVLVCPMMQISTREKCELYEKLPNPLDECITETRSLNPIKEENKMESWKERLKEEYAQLKERYEKLRAYNIQLEVKTNIAKEAPTEKEYYSNRLLARQQEIMADYLKVLELRVALADIEL